MSRCPLFLASDLSGFVFSSPKIQALPAVVVAGGMWESGVFVFCRISKRGGKRGKLVFVFGVFHAFLGASFPQRGARAFFEVSASCCFAESGSPLALKRPTTCGP